MTFLDIQTKQFAILFNKGPITDTLTEILENIGNIFSFYKSVFFFIWVGLQVSPCQLDRCHKATLM